MLSKIAAYARWQNALTSFAALVAGIVLSFGHHLFYSYLDDRCVATQPYLIRQWSVSIGTGVAFLAHEALAISIGITFWQLFWSTLHRKSLTLSTIDALAESWSSWLELLNIRVIKASPVLVLLALTSTIIIPTAVIFPPGTLRVKIDVRDTMFYNQKVAAPAWDKTGAFAEFSSQDGHYLGPTRNLIRMSSATVYQMDLPALPKMQGVPNASYELSMYAPTIQCRETSSQILSNFTAIFNCTEGPCSTCGNEQNVYTYLGWAPLCNGTKCAANPHSDVLFNDSLPAYIRNVGTPGYGPAQLYISTLNGHPATNWSDLTNWQTLNCSLYNASQVATFTFNSDDSLAQFDSSRMTILNPVTLSLGDRIADNAPNEQSYLALMDTLGGMLAGTVLWEHDFREWLVRDTVIVDSKLGQTAQISNWSDLNDNQTEWDIPIPNTKGIQLASAIEELFHNMTLSLFAHSDFTDQVTINEIHSALHTTHFEYSPRNLLLSYGAALILTAVIALLGYRSVAKEGKSYSNRFSTVVRTIQDEELNAAISDHHRGGEDPLPKHLAKTKVTISRPRTISFAVVEDPIPMINGARKKSRDGSGSLSRT